MHGQYPPSVAAHLGSHLHFGSASHCSCPGISAQVLKQKLPLEIGNWSGPKTQILSQARGYGAAGACLRQTLHSFCIAILTRPVQRSEYLAFYMKTIVRIKRSKQAHAKIS